MKVKLYICASCGYRSLLQQNTRRHASTVCGNSPVTCVTGEVSVSADRQQQDSRTVREWETLPPWNMMTDHTKARLADRVRRALPTFIQHIDAYTYRVSTILSSDDGTRDRLRTLVDACTSFDELFVAVYRIAAGDQAPTVSATFVWKLDVGRDLSAGKLKYFQKCGPLSSWKRVVLTFTTNVLEHLLQQCLANERTKDIAQTAERVIGTVPVRVRVDHADPEQLWTRITEHIPILEL